MREERAGSRSSILGPYVSPEATESAPLRGRTAVHASPRQWCTSCNESEPGLTLILAAFAVVSIGIAIALMVQIHLGEPEVRPKGAVVTDSLYCTKIAREAIEKGGNAVDAAVAGTLCMGVVHPHVTGLGGGGFMVVRDHITGECHAVDFRETAPEHRPVLDAEGAGDTVGVPGTLAGLYLAHRRLGVLPWESVVLPSVTLAQEGFPVPRHLESALQRTANQREWMKALFEIKADGITVHRPALAGLLQRIASDGPDAFYQDTAGNLTYVVRVEGGGLSPEDMHSYKARWVEALLVQVLGVGVCVPGPPSAGPQLLAIMNLMESQNSSVNASQAIHHLLESVRIASIYQSQLGDPYLETGVWNLTEQMVSKTEAAEMRCQVSNERVLPEHATPEILELVGTHVAAMDANDLQVSVISGLGDLFGSGIVHRQSGVVLNNALTHFAPSNATSSSGASNNVQSPGKRPLSKYSPAVVWEWGRPCGRRLATGATDASLAAEVLLGWMSSGKLEESVEGPRVIAQASTARLRLEQGKRERLPKEVVDELHHLGYTFQPVMEPYPSVNMVQRIIDDFSAYADSRGGGSAQNF